MAGYCTVTALLWKQFWQPGTSGSPAIAGRVTCSGTSSKNFSLAGGFLLITLGGWPRVPSWPTLRFVHPYASHGAER